MQTMPITKPISFVPGRSSLKASRQDLTHQPNVHAVFGKKFTKPYISSNFNYLFCLDVPKFFQEEGFLVSDD